MNIDLVFDTACPWCFIGKRRFFAALRARETAVPTVAFRPFILNPEFPETGLSWDDFLHLKFPDSRRIGRTLEAIRQAALTTDLEIRFDLIRRMPNTIRSHRLVRLGRTMAERSRLLDGVFSALFVRGLDTGDIGVLCEIGADVGLDPVAVRRHLESDADRADVLQDSERYHAMGLNGVPSFLFNGEIAIAGAQEKDVFTRMIEIAEDLAPEEPFSNTAATNGPPAPPGTPEAPAPSGDPEA